MDAASSSTWACPSMRLATTTRHCSPTYPASATSDDSLLGRAPLPSSPRPLRTGKTHPPRRACLHRPGCPQRPHRSQPLRPQRPGLHQPSLPEPRNPIPDWPLQSYAHTLSITAPSTPTPCWWRPTVSGSSTLATSAPTGARLPLFERMVRNPPRDIDVLLMEGTTIGRSGSDKGFPSEDDLEAQFADAFRNTKGVHFVWTSIQNIDRIVTIFRAARRTGRSLIINLYAAVILDATRTRQHSSRPIGTM